MPQRRSPEPYKEVLREPEVKCIREEGCPASVAHRVKRFTWKLHAWLFNTYCIDCDTWYK